MPRFIYILILALLLVNFDGVAQKRTAKSIRKQQQTTREEINETNKKIKSNTAETKKSLNRLNLIEAEISTHEKTISSISHELDSINKKMRVLKDSIKRSEAEIKKLKDDYSKAVSNIQARSSSFDRMLFIFSASDFNQAYRRMRYMRQFSTWREKQTEEIQKAQSRLRAQHSTVAACHKQRSAALAKQNNERLGLMKKRKQQSKEIASLKKEGKALQKVLAEKQRQAKELDEALNKLIAEEERKAAERAKQSKKDDEKRKAEPKKESKPQYSMSDSERVLSGSFESNKGRLLFPVAGSYKIVRPFGRHKHPELKYVQTDNNGIDIEVQAGTKARAVFDGKVSAIFRQDGFNTIVMVRHGNYLTIYVNLSEIYVSNGETVKANQPIGKIFSDPDDDNRTILHFEVRKEREKLNPQEWVK